MIKKFLLIIFCFCFYVSPLISETLDNVVLDELFYDSSQLVVKVDTFPYWTIDPFLMDQLQSAFNSGQSLSFDYDDSTYQIQSIHYDSVPNNVFAFSSIVSFFIGGLSAFAFALGISIRLTL